MDYLFIDGSNLLHRAWYALAGGVGGSEGADPREALALFGKMAARSIDFYHVPRVRVVACFDAGDSGRRVLYPAYKANRKPKPPALAETLALAPGFCVAQRWNVAAPEGFEADDTIASLVALAGRAGVRQVNVLSGDKDLYQLLGTGGEPGEEQAVVLTKPDGLEFDGWGFYHHFGFVPMRWPLYQAIVGEPGDNIIGVPGVGPKKATKLLLHYDNLSEMVEGEAGAGRILGGRDAAALVAGAEWVRMGVHLTTLRRDVPGVELP